MIHDFNGNKAFFVIVSAHRPNIVDATYHIAGTDEITWIVATGEKELYEKAGARHVMEGGKIVESRNLSLELAQQSGYPLLTMDDELHKICEPVFSVSKGKYISSPIDMNEAVRRLFEGFEKYPNSHFAGVAPTDNPFFYHGRPVNNKAFIVASFMLIKPTELRFDKAAELKEDYDFTIQNVLKFGCVSRRDDVLMSFSHKSTKGGVSQWRTPEIQDKVIEYLYLKWHGRFITKNPRRRGEMLLKF